MHRPPFQQFQSTGTGSLVAAGEYGSLKASNTTAGLSLKADADRASRTSTEWVSGHRPLPVGGSVPGADQCRSRITYSPAAFRSAT